MEIPDHLAERLTEDEALRAISEVVEIISPSFVFAYYDLDDIKQEATIEGLKALAKYDGVRDLKNFLWVHIRNRLLNLKRNKYKRTDAPCLLCHNQPDGQTRHRNRLFCDRYRRWYDRNVLRKNLLYTQDIDQTPVADPSDSDAVSHKEELFRLIDEKLPTKLREYYLKMRSGLTGQVPKAKRQQVLRTVQKILKGLA